MESLAIVVLMRHLFIGTQLKRVSIKGIFKFFLVTHENNIFTDATIASNISRENVQFQILYFAKGHYRVDDFTHHGS
ncbi:unnamed protein product [Rotaria socialis]